VWGSTGWLGNKLCHAWPEGSGDIIPANSRLEAVDDTIAELAAVKPNRVIIAAALTGVPTVDWCDAHKAETLAVNYAGTLALVRACSKRGIHCTLLGSGCIYEHDEKHPNVGDSSLGFTEEDAPNFIGSFYSRTKAMLEEDIKGLENVLLLRIRMPVTGDGSARCLLTKLLSYKKHVVGDQHNSITFIPDMLPLIPILASSGVTGVYNFVQPNALTHRTILACALGPKAEEYNFVPGSEAASLTAAPRSNCSLNPDKLQQVLKKLDLPPLRTASACLSGLLADS